MMNLSYRQATFAQTSNMRNLFLRRVPYKPKHQKQSVDRVGLEQLKSKNLSQQLIKLLQVMEEAITMFVIQHPSKLATIITRQTMKIKL